MSDLPTPEQENAYFAAVRSGIPWQQATREALSGAQDAAEPVHPASPEGGNGGPSGGEASWPEPLDPAALHGLAGEIVATIEPHTEADPAALLVTLLVAFGSAAGRGPGWTVGGDFHATNLYAAFVGETASGRKGTSWGEVRRLMERADPEWAEGRVASGLSSGEGVIHHVRDDLTTRRRARTKEERRDADGDGLIEEVNPGVADKRLLVMESELGQGFKAMQREGNTLSPVVRGLWDHGSAGNLTKNAPERTTGAHVSIIGHVTPRELRDGLTEAERANGFANRFLLVCVKRARSLPFGGELAEGDLDAMGRALAAALARARDRRVLDMDTGAREAWKATYEPLTERPDGMLGAITGRAVPLVRRLAVIYALLDQESIVGLAHLRAALAVWGYCERSAAHVFGGILGDRLADRLLAELRGAGTSGLTRSTIRTSVGHHLGAEEVGRALAELEARGLARCERCPTGGRPREHWYIAEVGGKPLSGEESPRSSTFLPESPLSSPALVNGERPATEAEEAEIERLAAKFGAAGSSAAKRLQIGMSDAIGHCLSWALEAVVPRSYPRVALNAAAARSLLWPLGLWRSWEGFGSVAQSFRRTGRRRIGRPERRVSAPIPPGSTRP